MPASRSICRARDDVVTRCTTMGDGEGRITGDDAGCTTGGAARLTCERLALRKCGSQSDGPSSGDAGATGGKDGTGSGRADDGELMAVPSDENECAPLRCCVCAAVARACACAGFDDGAVGGRRSASASARRALLLSCGVECCLRVRRGRFSSGDGPESTRPPVTGTSDGLVVWLWLNPDVCERFASLGRREEAACDDGEPSLLALEPGRWYEMSRGTWSVGCVGWGGEPGALPERGDIVGGGGGYKSALGRLCLLEVDDWASGRMGSAGDGGRRTLALDDLDFTLGVGAGVGGGTVSGLMSRSMVRSGSTKASICEAVWRVLRRCALRAALLLPPPKQHNIRSRG